MLYVHRLTLLIIAILITFITQAEAKEVFMEMPSPCYSVEAIKKDKVYLKEDEKACVQVIPKTIIKIDDDVDKVAVYVQGRLWNTQSVNKKDIDLEKIAGAVEEQKKKLEAGLIINNDDEATRRADKAAKNFYAEKYQSILNKERERIKADTFKIAEKEKNETYPEAAKNNPQSLSKDSNIYIFVSSSMPPNTLRAYVQDAAALKEKNVIIVLRGMIGEPPKIKATAKYVKKLMQKDPACQRKCKVYKARFAIDPHAL